MKNRFSGIFGSIYTVGLVAFTIIFSSCGNQDNTGLEETVKSTADTTLAVNEGVYQFTITIDRDETDPCIPSCRFNENTGDFEITCGEEFGLVLTQMSSNISAFKTEFEASSFFKMRVIEETSDYLFYQLSLPDGTPHFFHIYSTKMLGDKPFVVRTIQEVDYTEQQVMRMLESVKSLGPLHR